MLILGLDGLVRLARLKYSSMDVLEVAFQLVVARKAGVVVFTHEDWAREFLGLDAMLGRVVAFEVAEPFSDGLAVGLAASIISRLAVMVSSSLMLSETPDAGCSYCCPLTTRNAAAQYP